MGNFKMTYNEAMVIQHSQMMYYRRWIGRSGIKAIRSRTKPLIGDPDKLMFVGDINKLVPRGGAFEGLIKNRPSAYDPTQMALHDAIRRGLPYY